MKFNVNDKPEKEFGEEREDEEDKNEQWSRGERAAALAKLTEGGAPFLPEPAREVREARGPRALLPRESGEEDERIAADAI